MQDFHWNIEGEIQTEGQENAGLRWALLGLGQTLGSAGPGVALLALSFCAWSVSVLFAVLGTCCSPTLNLYLRPYSKHMETKQNSTGLETGELNCIEISNRGHITFEREIHER